MSELSEEGEVRSPVHVKVIPVITPTRRDQVRGDRRGSGWNQNNFRGRGGGMRYSPAGHRGHVARMSYPNNPRGGPMSGSNGRQWKERGMGRGHPPRHEPRYEPRHHNYNPFFHRNGHRENPGRGRAQAREPPRTPLVTPLQPQPQQEPSVPAKDLNLKEDRNKFRLDMATLMTQFEAQVDGVLGVVDEEGRRKFQGLMIRSFFALSIEKQDSSPANRSRLAQCLNEMLGYVKKTLGTTPAGKNLPLLPNDPEALALTPGAPPDARVPFWTIAPPPALLGQIPGLNGNRPCSSAAQGESPQDYSLPCFGPFAKQSSPSCPPEPCLPFGTSRPVNNKGGFSRSDQDERVWSGQRGQGSGMQTRPGSGWGGY